MEKISFYKKIWWSIARPSKYIDMMKTGLIKGIKYFLSLVVILAVLLSVLGTSIQVQKMQELGEYIDNNIPEFKIENVANNGENAKYRLNIENYDTIILDNQDFIKSFNSIVVVNTNIKEKDAIKEYYKLSTENNYCLILLEHKCIIISSKYKPENENKDEGIIKYNYDEMLKQYINNEKEEFNKQDVLNVFTKTSYEYYVIMYFLNYFIILLALFTFYVIALGCATIISFKILKNDITTKQAFILPIYSCTLSMVLYVAYQIFSYFMNFSYIYINFVILSIAIIYILLYYFKNKKKSIA